METVILKAKQLIGLTSDTDDLLLELYYEIATEEVTSYCGELKEIPESLIAQMIMVKYQRRGTESISSSNYAGNGESYLADYPPSILNRLESLKKGNRRIKML